MKKSILILASFLVLNLTSSLNAQTFGFGCLGLSGFYGGYGIHTYDAVGLNESLNLLYNNNLIDNSTPIKFEKATGFRFGANILRADFNHVFLTAKGFFQFSREQHSFENPNQSAEIIKNEYELITNHWGIGLDFGLPVFSFLHLKLLEGGITFYNVELKEKTFSDDELLNENKYDNESPEIGYYVGTGLIINIIEGYISLEGTAMYHFYKVETLKNADDINFVNSSINNHFIEKGGFAAAVQLNLGFPL